MVTKEVREDDYCIRYEASSTTVLFEGKLSLRDPSEYTPMTDLLEEVLDTEPTHLTLDLQKLEFLNSSGIRVLSKFVSSLKKKKSDIQLTILGSTQIAWQGKSLKNLQKFLPSLILTLQ